MISPETFNILHALLVFLSTTFTEVLWVFYIRRTTSGKALQAALFSTTLVVVGAYVVISYIENKWYIVPAGLGSFIGTILAVRYDRKQK